MSPKKIVPSSKQVAPKKKLVLLDTFAILHRGYHALPGFVSARGEPTGALYGLALFLFSVIKDFRPDEIIAAFDLPDPTFRDELYKDYKAGRAKTDDELIHQIDRSRDLLAAFDIPIYEAPGFEADDILGTIVEQTKNNKEIEIIVASGDMDTMSLAADKRVKIYTLKKGIKDTVTYDWKGVIERYGFGPELVPDYKALRGDPSDNIIGVPGIGEKTATELVQKFGGIEKIYKKLKSKKGKEEMIKGGVKERVVNLLLEHEEEAYFSLVLATIRTDAPVKFSAQDGPASGWKVNEDKVRTIFEELGFRSLIGRLSGPTAIPEKRTYRGDSDYYKIKLAEWVLDSNNTSPSGEGKSDELIEKLKKEGLYKVYEEIELPLEDILRKAEGLGILINKKRLDEIASDYHKKQDELVKSIHKEAGQEFNINSPKQMGEVLFDKLQIHRVNPSTTLRVKKTKTGAYSTNAEELEKLKGVHPIIDTLLAHREIAKLLSTYVDAIPPLLDASSRLHTHFIQWGSATGRPASRDPNLQNIPIKTELGKAIREAFVASPGYAFASLDYSQIDLRSLAILSRDPKLTNFFRSGGDIHELVAKEIFGTPGNLFEEKIDREMRRKAKVINFGIIYGMGVMALKQNLGVSKDEAQIFYNKYFERFPGVRKYLDETIAFAHKNGYTETLFGRKRYYPEINRGPEYVQKSAERQASNAPVQGTSADIIKVAMVEVDKWIKKEKLEQVVRLLLQIHDELIYEIKKEKAEELAPEIKKIMESVVPNSPVPIPVKYSTGPSWASL